MVDFIMVMIFIFFGSLSWRILETYYSDDWYIDLEAGILD
jgi:hypothetical protein